jgi:myo-inositol-1(or 4)-monophosphatase
MTSREEPRAIELLDLAVEVAVAAGGFLAPRSGRATVTATKSSPTDLVTADDLASERLIRERIGAQRPGDGFLGEELGASAATTTGDASAVRWVIDPLDGTVNFYYGLPTWSVSVAAEVDDVAVAGVVEAPLLRRRYTAVAGGGAWCNGVAITASRVDKMSEALLATGFSYESAVRETQGRALGRLLPNVRDVRRLGSAALDLCLLASGQVDCYFERGLGEHDRAAGLLIAREAGATVAVDGTLTWGSAAPLATAFLAALHDAGA